MQFKPKNNKPHKKIMWLIILTIQKLLSVNAANN